MPDRVLDTFYGNNGKLVVTNAGLMYFGDETISVETPKSSASVVEVGTIDTVEKTVAVRFVRVTGGVEVQIPDRRSKVKDALITKRFQMSQGETLDDVYVTAKAWVGNRLWEIDEEEKRLAEEKARDERWPAEMTVEFTRSGREIVKKAP